MANILVTGSKGQLGSELKQLADTSEHLFCFLDAAQLDICDVTSVAKVVVDNDIEVIVNCAAYTAVDAAEDDETLADKINHLAVQALAEIAKKHTVKLIHISTDYVFSGTHHRPYVETDKTDPQSVYGRTKLAGEKALQAINPTGSVIIRTSWLYSSYGKNFVKTMLQLGQEKSQLNVVSDQVGSPTYAQDLAVTILDLIPSLHNDAVSIYHYANAGVASWYDFASAIMRQAGLACEVNDIGSEEYSTRAHRPFYSVLNTAKIRGDFDIRIPHWQDSLRECLQKLGTV